MVLSEFLKIQRGVTAVIGGGGKTTLLETLGKELSARGSSVLLCTTTKMYPYDKIPFVRTGEEIDQKRQEHLLLCAGTPMAESGKITAPRMSFADLMARFDYVLVEADGSAQLPLKAHASREPVVPPEANQVILVLGASGIDGPICEAAHRPELYAQKCGTDVADCATPERIARVIHSEKLHTRVLINQVDDLEQAEKARCLAALLDCSTVIGSLQRGEYILCSC